MTQLCKILEAILFVSGEPLQIAQLSSALEVTDIEIIAAADELADDYDQNQRGICLKKFGSHIQLSTRPDYAPQIEKLLQPVQRQSLSQAALETLAVIAYKQPVTRLDIEAVRGVKCDYSVQSLAAKGLIQKDINSALQTVKAGILYASDLPSSMINFDDLEDLKRRCSRLIRKLGNLTEG